MRRLSVYNFESYKPIWLEWVSVLNRMSVKCTVTVNFLTLPARRGSHSDLFSTTTDSCKQLSRVGCQATKQADFFATLKHSLQLVLAVISSLYTKKENQRYLMLVTKSFLASHPNGFLARM